MLRVMRPVEEVLDAFLVQSMLFSMSCLSRDDQQILSVIGRSQR